MKKLHKRFNIKEHNAKNTFKLSEVIILLITTFILTGSVSWIIYMRIYAERTSQIESLNDVINTYHNVYREFYEDVDGAKLASAAIDGMMSYLDEQYSEYLSSEESNILKEKLNGEYQGIGILVQNVDNLAHIKRVYKDTPAFKAGLQEGDIILTIDKQEVTFSDLADHLAKTKDDFVVGVRRQDAVLEIKMRMGLVAMQVVTSDVYQVNDELIGYLSLTTFSNKAYEQMQEELAYLENKGISSLIIDLRDNAGGYLDEAEAIAAMFSKKGAVLFSLENKSTTTAVYDDTSEQRTYNIVVLMNENTASASEVLLASLKENNGAILVGTTSFGKGKVQQTAKLSNSGLIKYTSAKWFTPNGNSLDTIGYAPDIRVHQSVAYLQNPLPENDAYLQMALTTLSTKSK